MKILVVEDDPSMLDSLCIGLGKRHYAVDKATDGQEAIDLIEVNEYDVVVLDLNLPKLDGTQVLRMIRQNDLELGVLILSARDTVEDKVLALDAGANDYLAKPFHFTEFEARLRALSRRKFIQQETVLSCGELTVNTSTKCVWARGELVDLTNKEYGILEYLLLHRDSVVSAEELIEHVWDSTVDLFSNSLKVHMSSLKKKLASHLGDVAVIENRRHMGYQIVDAGRNSG